MRAGSRTATATSWTSVARSSSSPRTPGCSYEGPRRVIGFQDQLTPNVAGEGAPTVSVTAVMDELRQRGYGEEFFGRQIDFIVFEAMRRDDVMVVLERLMATLQDTAELRGYQLQWEPAVLDHLLDEWTPRFGARWAFKILQDRVGEQLNLAAAQGELEARDGMERVTRICLVKRPADDVPGGEGTIAGLAARRRDGDTLTILVH